MLLKCSYVIELWNQVWQWNTDVGGNDYNLSDSMEIAGDIANNPVFNIKIIGTKTTIYNSKVECKLPTF